MTYLIHMDNMCPVPVRQGGPDQPKGTEIMQALHD